MKNRNYQILKNINEFINFKNIINNDINELINENGIIMKLNNIMNIEYIMNNKYDEKNTLENKYYIEYINKIDYKFINEPKNLKYKLDVTDTNDFYGYNIFEVFISYKDNKEYLVSKNINNFNLDVFSLLNIKKIFSLEGHKNRVITIRYFINNSNYNEYLISADNNGLVIIWDITNEYNIIYQIDTYYITDEDNDTNINSCLLLFIKNNNYIITSTGNISDDNNKSATKVYSLDDGKFIKYINNTKDLKVCYLLYWYNNRNYKHYIIHLAYKKIIINNLLEGELYSELIKPEDKHVSGLIYNKDNNDYLCSSSENGYINIWDLYNKNLFKVINTYNCFLMHIIEWNSKYIIVGDYKNKSFIIIDIEKYEIICDIQSNHTQELKTIKKLYHPIYGESLLSASRDKKIKLWSF